MKTLYVPCLSSLDNLDLDTALELQGGRFAVDQVNWPQAYPYAPFCAGRVARTDTALVVDFRVSGLDLRVQNLQDGGRQWEDSCVECFLQGPGDTYFNVEVNAAGKILAAQGAGRENRTKFAPEQTAEILRFATVEGPVEHAGGIWNWRVTVLIPFALIGLDGEHLPPTLRVNFYKCGDKTAHPHFLSWSPIATPSPDFHRPEYFGELQLVGVM